MSSGKTPEDVPPGQTALIAPPDYVHIFSKENPDKKVDPMLAMKKSVSVSQLKTQTTSCVSTSTKTKTKSGSTKTQSDRRNKSNRKSKKSKKSKSKKHHRHHHHHHGNKPNSPELEPERDDLNQHSQPTGRVKRTTPPKTSCSVNKCKQEKSKTREENTDNTAAPTALIAPEDYIHIYKGSQNPPNCEQNKEDNLPTALIAPEDYIHIYKGGN